MLLKKQTVWLLTMLSLVVVLSVYYVTSPENKTDNLAFVENDKETAAEETKAEESKATETGTEEAEDGTVISSIQSDELFATLRLEMDEQRSKLIEQLQTTMAATDVSAEQKSKAYDQMIEVQAASSKERVLETLILAESKEYKDVLVRADGDKVKIVVRSEKHSAKEANKIIQLVREELGAKQVAVEFSKK
ncbi:SpoIIIAH-like family protein [Bacillus suaedaesalsae]|uniref:SpoIIIAH-like family protein n=1 Tax=Bacillus suaedaesalsae TaxID=2810349 RepID=A0ABS2DFU9_9BACI|nr:SpoIIIAH-like family protein [Bacillus suaedaesalsae]MBM6617335.1 SpoIIIAH-like family protein [Bacillus suaedaesalsae]